MANEFTTSVNILRDTESDFNYIPTPNAKQVVGQIVNDFKKGLRSFNIVGTYGTGKSSFLWALEQSLRKKRPYFEANLTRDAKVDFLKIVGSYTSLIEHFAEIFDVRTETNKQEYILSEIFNSYHSLNDKNAVLLIFIDEFGKFLEYTSKHSPESELYFIQQLCEFCNNPKYNILLITTVHQSFESYAYALGSSQKQEWTKVKGRFREITFNEPVEQLLFLASEHIGNTRPSNSPKRSIQACLQLVVGAKAFSYNENFLDQIATSIFPLDILAASVLTLSLQKYGQNERSLFTFLESTDHTGISRFNNDKSPFYNVSSVFDYLNFNFYSFLTSKYNPDFSSWSSIRSAIERVEGTFDTSVSDYVKAVKTIGLLNIFCVQGAILDNRFLSRYLDLACGITNSAEIIEHLERKKIIRFRSHNSRYILFEGTDLDIETALIEAGNKITEVGDVTSLLSKYFRFPALIAKHYSYETGTPRFFEFKISEYPLLDDRPEGEIDGVVNLIFNTNLQKNDIQKVSNRQEEAIIYCFYQNSRDIKNLLFEIEKIQRVIEENKDDKIARRELENIVDSQIRLLNHYISDSIYANGENVVWYFKGEQKEITSKKDFNKLLSQACSVVYNATPIFKNELLNKHRISPSIHTAKKNFFKALVNNWNEDGLGFEESKFPPEKTIYLSLLKENGISPLRDTSLENIGIDDSSSFAQLWQASEKFLASAKSETKNISEFVSILDRRPFKLKQGLIDFWVPTFLFLKRDDFAVFGENGYIPNLSEEVLELISKNPNAFSLKTFDIEGVKLDIFNSYRTFLNQSTQLRFDNTTFIETIRPFIVFYKQLPAYSKQTKRLSSTALKVREAITASKDPEQTFFDSFPHALGISLRVLQQDKSKLHTYATNLQSAIKELRTSFDELVLRFEEFICNEFLGYSAPFEVYKEHLRGRFSKLKKHLLLSGQKTFVHRVDSALEDRKAWLTSLAQALVGKTLETFSDDDEIMLYERFRAMVLELDSLTTISKVNVDDSVEDIVSVKIDTFFSTISPKIVRTPRSKKTEIEMLQAALRTKLGNDKTANVAAVVNLLKELLQ